MSQSFTSMDARTQPLTQQDIREVDIDYIRTCLLNSELDPRTRELMEQELIDRTTPKPINPIYLSLIHI